MNNSIEDFYQTIISPFVLDFKDNRASLRLAYGAAWALDSFASHIFYFYEPSITGLGRSDIDFKKSYLSPESTDFVTILDVSAAAKHAIRSSPQKVSIAASSEVTSINLEGWAAWSAGPDADNWGEQVIINNDKYLFQPFLPVVLRAEQFLLRKKETLQTTI